MSNKSQNKLDPPNSSFTRPRTDKRGWNYFDELSTHIRAGTGACPYGDSCMIFNRDIHHPLHKEPEMYIRGHN